MIDDNGAHPIYEYRWHIASQPHGLGEYATTDRYFTEEEASRSYAFRSKVESSKRIRVTK